MYRRFIERLCRHPMHLMNLLRKYGLWRGISWGVAAVALYDGSGYLWKGNSLIRGTAFVVLRNTPGGMHTHGVILLALAALIFYTSANKGRGAKTVMFLVFVYAVWVTCAVVAGWFISKTVTWSAPSKWFFLAWVAFLLSATTQQEGFEPVSIRLVRETDDQV